MNMFNMGTLDFFGLFLLTPCVTTLTVLCRSYPSPDFTGVGFKCSGLKVTQVPMLLDSRLKLLHLAGTAISSLEDTSFQERDLGELTTLSVTGGSLTSVDASAFCSLPALTKLDLSHNNLQRLDASSFKCNKKLKIVDLSHNPSFRHFPLWDSSSIEAIYMDYCNLTSVDVAALKGVTELKILSLRGNRHLNCPSERKRLEQALPDLSVICEDSMEYKHALPRTGGQEYSPESAASSLRQSLWTMVVVTGFVFKIFH